MNDDIKINAVLVTLQTQRNNALNSLAQLQGELATANAAIAELRKKLEAAAQPTKEDPNVSS